ncbi:C-_U-editing enzyme APOBEC-2a isoform X2 [Silurus meridionalis]|uniref:C->U-editing enzyme APOBEC-2a isoform X2 n=1 Tax=Silurus meridionalis TaxID=175797 RepID=UPI001EEADC5E|nr:C->U-editing enzyme APOBEC-2a isoform X2 [Silurus meridionalis]
MTDQASSSGRLRKDRVAERQMVTEEKEDKGSKEEDMNGAVNGDTAVLSNGAAENEKPEVMELPPFQIITGDQIDPFFFKFQYKNVEYSSGRNKTFLCYLVNEVRGAGDEAILRGFVEDEHASGDHAEDAFFRLVLPHYNASARYNVTWYVSSSPCPSCAAKLVEILRERKTLRLTIFSARLFEWEEPEVRAGLKSLAGVGCKLRMMKPLDFSYTWDTFVENDGGRFEPWEDCQENYEFYQDKLADILQ